MYNNTFYVITVFCQLHNKRMCYVMLYEIWLLQRSISHSCRHWPATRRCRCCRLEDRSCSWTPPPSSVQYTHNQPTVATVTPASVNISHSWSSQFLPARRYANAPVLAMALCVCLCLCRLSQFVVLSKRINESGWFLACKHFSSYPTLCFKEIRDLQK